MAHKAQINFCLAVKNKFPASFRNARVLDVGSLDINGSNRDLFDDCEYIGLDIAPGRNVDVVSLAHEYDSDVLFDTIISTEMLEHDRHYPQTLHNIVRLLSPGGLLLFTCATGKRAVHGTRHDSPSDSPFTSATPGWDDYYKNLSAEDIINVIPVSDIFVDFRFKTADDRDLQFWGVKKC